MKKTRVVASATEISVGSPSRANTGVDVSRLYLDILCEKFNNRGIKTGVMLDAERRREKEKILGAMSNSKNAPQIVSAYDDKYKKKDISGKTYMSCDGFAAYYKDLRGYKTPSFNTRAENEYREAAADVQDSGKPPKKAKWLTVRDAIKAQGIKLSSFFTQKGLERFVAEWFPIDNVENRREVNGRKLPPRVLSTMAIVAISLLLIVCSSVMVSRASAKVSELEEKIERLEYTRDDLQTDLELKNNMLDIQRIAVEEYGMIKGDYAASRYLDITEEEKIEVYESQGESEGIISRLLRAVGLK